MTFLRDSSQGLLHEAHFLVGPGATSETGSANANSQGRRGDDALVTFEDSPSRPVVDNAIAYCIALIGDPELLPEGRKRAENAYAELKAPQVAGTLGAVLVQTGHPEEGLRLLELSRSAIDIPLDLLETERFTVTGYLTKRNVFQARQAFRRGMQIPDVDQTSLHRVAPALGAAEAALWLRRFAEGVVPTREELADWATTIGTALAAWLSADLDNDRRWALFDAAGGDRSTLSTSSMNALAKLTKALQNESARSHDRETADVSETSEN